MQVLLLMGDFYHLSICWRDDTAGHKQSRMFLERVHGNLLLREIKEPMKSGAMVDLVLTTKVMRNDEEYEDQGQS